MNHMAEAPEFDGFADDYDVALARGLSLTGESRDYFARRRVAWTGRRLGQLGASRALVIDFGCGDGATLPLLARGLNAGRVVGLEVSGACAERARVAGGGQWTVVEPGCRDFDGAADVVYCNGVLHHVAPEDRAGVIDSMRRLLKQGGWLALWENNAWNPGTRWVMSRIPFDRDARPLSAIRVRRLLAGGGFETGCTDHLFLFPRWAARLRPLESLVCKLPIGGQYMVLGRKRS